MLLLILGFLTDFRVFTARWKVSSPLHSDRANQSCYKNELSGRAALLKDVSFENRAWAVQDGDGEAGWVSFGHAWPRPRALRGPPQKNPNSPCKSSIRSIPSVCGSLAPPGSFFLSPPPSRVPVKGSGGCSIPSPPCPARGGGSRGLRGRSSGGGGRAINHRGPRGTGKRTRESRRQSGGDSPRLREINGNKSKWGLPGAGGARGPPRSARERRSGDGERHSANF